MSFFSKIFKKEPQLSPIDLSILKVDFHSHLIPGIDDGSKSMEETISMLKRFKALGYKKVITSPHVMSDYYKNTPEIILGGVEKVKEELRNQNIDIEFGAAAEYYLDEELENKIKKNEVLTFGNKHLLFELPFFSEPPNLDSIIFDMQTNGYQAVLAHPERYGYWYQDFDRYHSLKERGVELQLNILSLIGHYSPETQKIAEQMVDNNLVDYLCTDCHNERHLDLIEIARTKPYVHKLIESGLLKNNLI